MVVLRGVDEYHIPVEKVPLNTCEDQDCVLLFEPAPWDKHTFLSDLQINYPWDTQVVAFEHSLGGDLDQERSCTEHRS
jgi:hypothetical protein